MPAVFLSFWTGCSSCSPPSSGYMQQDSSALHQHYTSACSACSTSARLWHSRDRRIGQRTGWAAWSGAMAAARDTLLLAEILRVPGDHHLPPDVRRSMQQPRSGSSSGANQQATTLSVEAVRQTVQFVCLDVVVQLLTLLVQQAAASETAAGSSSRRGGRGSGSTAGAAGSAAAGGPWLPAVLAPSMPAAYSTMLEQLGCSRELGLWIAMAVKGVWAQTVLKGLDRYDCLVVALEGHGMLAPQQAALHLSVAAAILQWLSETPQERLAGMSDSCFVACTVARTAYRAGQDAMQQQPLPLDEQQAAGVRAQALVASQAIVESSMSVLDKLLGMCRGMPDSGQASSSSRAGNTSSSNSTRSTLLVLRSCAKLTELLTDLLNSTARANGHGGAASGLDQGGPLTVRLLLAQHTRCCQLLQDFARLVAATAAATQEVSDSATLDLLIITVDSLDCLLCNKQAGHSEPWDRAGPLVAPVAAAGSVSSPSVLQLFGLLSTVQKLIFVITALPPQPAAIEATPGAWERATSITPVLRFASSVVSTAVVNVLQAVLCHGPVSSSSSSSSCAATLPWLVLLGRSCLACAAVLQHLQGTSRHYLGTEVNSSTATAVEEACSISAAAATAPGTVAATTQDQAAAIAVPMFKHSWAVSNLQRLQTSLGSIVQWLTAVGVEQQLAALGYQPQEMQQQLAEAAGALACLLGQLPDSPCTVDARLSAGPLLPAICVQLLAAGRVLATIAIPHACNNPACTNVSGPSEAQLVGGRSCICAGCRTARYCGRACQRQAWRQHKPVCKALAAAAAAATAGSNSEAAAFDMDSSKAE